MDADVWANSPYTEADLQEHNLRLLEKYARIVKVAKIKE